MKILETAVLSQMPQLIEELTASLRLKKESVAGIDVFRLEVEPDFIILLYDLSVEKELPGEVVVHLKDHLSALLILFDEVISELPEDGASFIDGLAKDLVHKPTVVAVRSETAKVQKVNLTTNGNGFYLSNFGRILFWHPELSESQKQVWHTLWGTLQPIS